MYGVRNEDRTVIVQSIKKINENNKFDVDQKEGKKVKLVMRI